MWSKIPVHNTDFTHIYKIRQSAVDFTDDEGQTN